MPSPRARFTAALFAAATLAVPTAARGDVLWNQFDNDAASSIQSVILPPPYDAGSQEVADDFLVTGSPWSVSEVDVHGDNGAGEPNFVRVAFYADTGTLPADTPVVEKSNITPLTGLDTGNFAIALSPPVELAPGTYWLSVQAEEGGGDWHWTQRQSQNLHMTALRAGGGHGYNCPVWVSLTGCFHSSVPPDLSFRLVGTVASGSGPGPGPAPDTSAPALTASAPRSESLRHGYLTVKDQTNEAATATATGSVKDRRQGSRGRVVQAAPGFRLTRRRLGHAQAEDPEEAAQGDPARAPASQDRDRQDHGRLEGRSRQQERTEDAQDSPEALDGPRHAKAGRPLGPPGFAGLL
jgi:hypothetical protein